MKWKKKGMIYRPDGSEAWMKNFAQVPVPVVIDNKIRIFFTCRPDKNQEGSSVSYLAALDVNIDDPKEIIDINKDPILPLGGRGDFDEFGIHPVSVLRQSQNVIYLYYQGWERGYSVPYRTSLGLAISTDNGKTFEKYSKGPIMSRTHNEPYLENGFFVWKENGKYRMIYATCNEWMDVPGGTEPIYFLVQASSEDGIDWKRDGIPIIEPEFEKECAGRPTVLKKDGIYHLWFCYRNAMDFRADADGAYRIGYATSEDGKKWKRKDSEAGITLSDKGWDSEMMAYPYVISIKEQLYLFYNGNDFGRHGFGYAQID